MTAEGLTGRLLRVDLSTGKIAVEAIPEDVARSFLGGRGLGAYYFDREIKPGIDPLGLQNKLIFSCGPLLGTMVPGGNKVCVTFKSPLTGTYSYSLCGGHWGPELKTAGYDALVVEGVSKYPVYLFIDDESVSICPADHIWGQLIPETDSALRGEIGDPFVKVACIGPAGERLNRMACITADCYREFGRGGAGAVMGAKKLKALVIRGSRGVIVKEPGKIASISEKMVKDLKRHVTVQARHSYGTPEMVEEINYLGFWSTRNFSTGQFNDAGKLSGKAMKKEIVQGDSSCFSCPVACGKRSAINSASYGRVELEGPEFETIGLLGANCGVSQWEYIVQAAKICDSYGMDTMSSGAVVAMIMEAFEKGRISEEQLDGLRPRFGDGSVMVELLQRIGDRKGIGDLLAEGLQASAGQLGISDLAMHVKGLPLATYDPRGCKGMALTYGTSPKGAHHMVSPTMGLELAGNRFSVEGKGLLVRKTQQHMALVDSLSLCSSMRFVLNLEGQLQILEAATGLVLSEEEALRIGDRIINLERMCNVRMGFDRRHDVLPRRFLEEPLPEGLSGGQVVEMDDLLNDYYSVMGWDERGIPTPEKLKTLDLAT